MISIPVIALSQGYASLFFGRLLQGVSGGLVGIVVPLYLAECLSAQERGKGTGVFPVAADPGHLCGRAHRHLLQLPRGRGRSHRLGGCSVCGEGPRLAAHLLDVDAAGNSVCAGRILCIGVAALALPTRAQDSAALEALRRSRTEEQAALEMSEMEQIAQSPANRLGSVGRQADKERFAAAATLCSSLPAGLRHPVLQHGHGHQFGDRVQHRHPAAERTVGPARALGLRRLHLLELSADHRGHDAGRSQGPQVPLHDRNLGDHRCRSLCGTLFLHTEKNRYDAAPAVQAMAKDDALTSLTTMPAPAASQLVPAGTLRAERSSLAVIYSYGGFTATTSPVRTGDGGKATIEINRAACVPSGKVQAFFSNPFADLERGADGSAQNRARVYRSRCRRRCTAG